MKKFSELVRQEIFSNKKIAIVEKDYANCTFIINELCKILKISDFFSFYKNKTHYDHVDVKTETIFESAFILKDNLVIDDFFTAHNVFGINLKSGGCIYRSNSFDYKYARDFDLLILVSPLESGFSSVYDGNVKVTNRDVVLYDFNYICDNGIGVFD